MITERDRREPAATLPSVSLKGDPALLTPSPVSSQKNSAEYFFRFQGRNPTSTSIPPEPALHMLL